MKNTKNMGGRWREKREKREKEKLKGKEKNLGFLGITQYNSCLMRVFG